MIRSPHLSVVIGLETQAGEKAKPMPGGHGAVSASENRIGLQTRQLQIVRKMLGEISQYQTDICI